MRLEIVFRACSRAGPVRGGARVVDAAKGEIVRVCLGSLVRSAHEALARGAGLELSLVVVDDHSDAACLAAVRGILEGCVFETELRALPGTGNAASLRAAFELGRARARPLVYFVEDDYLHAPSAVAEMIDALASSRASFGREGVVFPCDHPDRYRDPYPSHIFLGNHRYWRTVRHTSGTFLTSHEVLEGHWERYMALAEYGLKPGVTEDTTINRVYETVPCVSPMPALAVHLEEPEGVSPFVDWRAWWATSGGRPIHA